MLYAIAVIAIQAMTLLHVIRSGRTQPWLFVVMILPLVGSIVYLIAEVLPDLMGQKGAPSAWSAAQDRIDPERRLRELREVAEANGTPQSLSDVAKELARLGRFAEAVEAYRGIMSGLYADDPELAFSAATAACEAAEAGQLTWAEAGNAFARLDQVDAAFRSKDRDLLRARLAAAHGDAGAADRAFQALTTGHASPEVRVRYAHFLYSQGRLSEARAHLDTVIAEAKRSTPHVRAMNSLWFGQAETALAIVSAAQAKL